MCVCEKEREKIETDHATLYKLQKLLDSMQSN